MVTELCTGGELYDEIAYQNNGIKEEEASFIMRQIISAVLYCHLQGIVHRNLKPENILMDSKFNNNIKLMEFGDSFSMDNEECKNESMKPLGTSYYIAPEVLDTQYESKCDMWSIGVIMYMLVTGKPPFDG